MCNLSHHSLCGVTQLNRHPQGSLAQQPTLGGGLPCPALSLLPSPCSYHLLRTPCIQGLLLGEPQPRQ